MDDNHFSGDGDTTPTYFGETYGDLLAAATGTDEELSHCERRRQERPRIVIEFNDTNARQKFITELLSELKQPLPDRQPAWRHVALWNTGGAIR
jgi:hypothetical protein